MNAEEVATALVAGLNSRSPEAVLAVLAGDVTYVTPRGEAVDGSTMVTKFMCAMWGTFPDARMVEERRLAAGTSVVLEMRCRGTNTGPIGWLQGAAPTGRQVDFRLCFVVDVDGERVRSVHHFMDRLTVNEQLGLTR
jgi:predicted ester cyclase